MQKYSLAFSLKKFRTNLYFKSKIITTHLYIRRIAKNIFSDSYTHLSTAQKHFCNTENVSFNTYRNVSFTTYKSMEEYARSIRLYTCAFAIYLSRTMGTIGSPVEGEDIATIRLSAKQSVTRS